MTKRQKEKEEKRKRQRPTREFNIVTSGQFCTIAIFLIHLDGCFGSFGQRSVLVTLLLFHFHTLTYFHVLFIHTSNFKLSHFQTFTPSNFHTFNLSHFQTFILSNFHTFTLSHFQTFKLPFCLFVFLSFWVWQAMPYRKSCVSHERLVPKLLISGHVFAKMCLER